MSDVTIWHNPRCSKSRETLALLRANGVEPVIVAYLSDPPSEAEIRAAQMALGIPIIEMMRVKEAAFSALGLRTDNDAAVLLAAMAQNPVLIERPIVLRAGKAAIGRPPEAVLALL